MSALETTGLGMVPIVIETSGRGERAYDIYSRLLVNRIVFLGTAIDDQVTNLVIAQLRHLESEQPDQDVALYINSPGGDMNGLFAIHDTMRFINPDVATICFGQAASAAAVLLAASSDGSLASQRESAALHALSACVMGMLGPGSGWWRKGTRAQRRM
jgi:ATP-dependent Clp protease protease subunit